MAVVRVALVFLATAGALRLNPAPDDERIVLTPQGPVPAWAVLDEDWGEAGDIQAKRHIDPEAQGFKDEARVLLEERVAGGFRPVIYFVGDSLMRHQYQSFCELATGLFPPQDDTWHVPGYKIMHNCSSELGYGVFLWSPEYAADVVDVVRSYGHPEPTLLYVVSAFHLMHMHPNFTMNKIKLKHCARYKDDLRELFDQTRRRVPNVGLTVMTPYAICESAYHDSWADLVKAHQQDPRAATQPCIDDMLNETTGYDKAAITDMCSKAWFLRDGSIWIRDMVREVVSRSADLPGGAPSLIDGWAMSDGDCDHTHDGRHWYRFNWLQLSQLLHMNT